MQLEIWSDIACPWCAISSARLDGVVDGFEHRDRLTIRYRSFELDPKATDGPPGASLQRLADKYGRSAAETQAMIDNVAAVAAGEGLEFRFDELRPANTFDAHRVLQLAWDRDVQRDAVRGLFQAHFTNGDLVSDHDTLVRVGAHVGLDEDEVRQVLSSDRYADAVRADQHEAASLGIRAVPFLVLDRAYAVSGAQPVEVVHSALDQAWAAHRALPLVPAQAPEPTTRSR